MLDEKYELRYLTLFYEELKVKGTPEVNLGVLFLLFIKPFAFLIRNVFYY